MDEMTCTGCKSETSINVTQRAKVRRIPNSIPLLNCCTVFQTGQGEQRSFAAAQGTGSALPSSLLCVDIVVYLLLRDV